MPPPLAGGMSSLYAKKTRKTLDAEAKAVAETRAKKEPVTQPSPPRESPLSSSLTSSSVSSSASALPADSSENPEQKNDKYNLKSVSDMRRLTVDLQGRDRITFLQDMRQASPDVCWDALMDHLKEHGKTPGVNGVATEQNYTRRIADGTEFVTHREDNSYEHTIMSLDSSNFDYATAVSVIVHLDPEYTANGLPPDAAGDVEIFLECCRFCVFSSPLTFTKIRGGRYIGRAVLVEPPNLIPLRHITWSSPSNIKLRERGRIVTQVDVTSQNILANSLVEELWFKTPAGLPVSVHKGMSVFSRKEFLKTVPRQFLHRYTKKKFEEVHTNED